MKIWIKTLVVFGICLLSLLLRFKVFPYKTHWSDMFFWKDWGRGILEYGTKGFYKQFGSDYLPFYPLVLGVVKTIYNYTHELLNIKDIYYYKFPAAISDIFFGYLIFRFLKEVKNYKAGILGMILFLFNPAVFANSSMWGQVDVIGTLFLFAGFYLLYKKKYWVSGLFLGLSLVTKALYLIAIPYLFLLFFRKEDFYINIHRKILKKCFLVFLGILVSIIVITLPFVEGGLFAVFKFLFERYKIISERYPYTSVNAFNFWGLVEKEFWLSDKRGPSFLTYNKWGTLITLLLIAAVYIKGFLNAIRKKWFYSLVLGISLLFYSSFLFLTRMHERHFFYVIPFLAVAAVIKHRLIIAYLITSLTYLLSLHFALEYYYQAKAYVFSSLQINLISGANVLVFFWLLFEFLLLTKNEKKI